MTRIVMLVHEEEGAFGGSFPDVPGCTTVARDVDTLVAKAPDVLAFHIGGLVEDGLPAPVVRTLGELRADPAFQEDASGAAIVLLDYEPPGRTVRVNITLNETMLHQIDRAAEAVGESRSGFLVSAARQRLVSAG